MKQDSYEVMELDSDEVISCFLIFPASPLSNFPTIIFPAVSYSSSTQ